MQFEAVPPRTKRKATDSGDEGGGETADAQKRIQIDYAALDQKISRHTYCDGEMHEVLRSDPELVKIYPNDKRLNLVKALVDAGILPDNVKIVTDYLLDCHPDHIYLLASQCNMEQLDLIRFSCDTFLDYSVQDFTGPAAYEFRFDLMRSFLVMVRDQGLVSPSMAYNVLNHVANFDGPVELFQHALHVLRYYKYRLPRSFLRVPMCLTSAFVLGYAHRHNLLETLMNNLDIQTEVDLTCLPEDVLVTMMTVQRKLPLSRRATELYRCIFRAAIKHDHRKVIDMFQQVPFDNVDLIPEHSTSFYLEASSPSAWAAFYRNRWESLRNHVLMERLSLAIASMDIHELRDVLKNREPQNMMPEHVFACLVRLIQCNKLDCANLLHQTFCIFTDNGPGFLDSIDPNEYFYRDAALRLLRGSTSAFNAFCELFPSIDAKHVQRMAVHSKWVKFCRLPEHAEMHKLLAHRFGIRMPLQ